MRRIIAVSLGVLLLVGCGGKRSAGGVVAGKVTYKGEPVNNALLQLYPASGGSNVSIPVNEEGAFRTSGVAAGEYKVVIQPSKADSGIPSLKGMDPAKAEEAKQKLGQMSHAKPTIKFPKKYQSHLTSDLKWNVVQGEQTLNLELTD